MTVEAATAAEVAEVAEAMTVAEAVAATIAAAEEVDMMTGGAATATKLRNQSRQAAEAAEI